ncbi:serine/threonine protein kinase [Candidatus Sumerlaeota bacterium]|nr:serine/threonine protein kinase [Candidatus Sumerlaeota bacterium]
MPSDDPLIGQTLDGYRIDRMIGKGSMGMVYHAIDVDSKAAVAVKTMSPESAEDKELLQRFQREARVANEIRHPNVAHVHLANFYGEMPYLVMEYIDGPTLADLVKQKGCGEATQALSIVRQAALGLKAATAHGSLHRDIKPANIMLTSKGVVKIVDFGIARNENDALRTAVGTVMGSPYYMSPEQSAAKPLDHRSDIYGLGATFYFMLTAHPPFEGKNLVDVIQKRAKNELVPIHTLNPNVPNRISEICYRMMKPKPEERFQTYDELIEAIDSVGKRPSTGAAVQPAPKKQPPAEPKPEMKAQPKPQPKLPESAAPPPPVAKPAVLPPVPPQAEEWPELEPLPQDFLQPSKEAWYESDIIPWVMIGLGGLLILTVVLMYLFF